MSNYTFTRTGIDIEEIHNTVNDLPNRISNANLIPNSDFSTPGSVSAPPDSAPRSYIAGDELFEGFYAVGGLTGVTYRSKRSRPPGMLQALLLVMGYQLARALQFLIAATFGKLRLILHLCLASSLSLGVPQRFTKLEISHHLVVVVVALLQCKRSIQSVMRNIQ